MANDMTGSPVAVTMVADQVKALIKIRAETGISLLSDLSLLSMYDFFAPLGGVPDMGGFDPSVTDAWVQIVVMNSMDRPLSLVNAFIDHGVQTFYPAIAGYDGSNPMKPHQIPAARPNPTQPGQQLTGVGMWMFQANTWGNVGGALSFSYKEGGAGPLIGVAFLNHPSSFHAPCSAVTADLGSAPYNGDLQAFYNATANAYTGVAADNGQESALWATFGPQGPVTELVLWARMPSEAS